MASSDPPPFKVKALFDYSSPHEDDLNFPADTVVTVTAIEDDDWYCGEYIDRASGERKEGIFPKNFVERLVVEVPARPPARAAKKKSAAVDEPQMPPTSPASPPLDKPNPIAHETQPPPPPPLPPPQPSSPSPSCPPPEESKPAPLKPAVETTAPRSPVPTTKPPPPLPPAAPAATAPVAATGKLPPPPPDKPSSSSFKDRLALFNKSGAAPVTPYNQLKPRPDFVKKPFVPPPPSKNAYIPPAVSHIPKPRRDEDTRPPPPPPSASVDEPERDPDQETKPKQSLKERIAMLQTQQLDPSALAAGKPKPRPKPKSRPSDPQPEEAAEALSPLSTNNPEIPVDEARASEREPAAAAVPPAATVPPPRSKRSIDIRREDIPDDLSVGDTDRSSVSIGPREARLRHPAATATHQSDFGDDEGANDTPDVPDSDDDEEDDDDDKDDDNGDDAEEVDPEVARKLALRERMMKMSGGMGMHGMFGPPMGMPIATGGPAAPSKKNKKKKEGTTTTSAKPPHAADEERLHEPEIPLPPVPVLPFAMPRVQSPPAVQKESDLGHDGDHGDAKHTPAGRKISQDSPRDEAVDIEDMKPSQSHSDKPHGPRPMPPRSPPGALGGS